MNPAVLLWFLLSTGGLLTLLLVVCGWICVRPASRAARACLVAIALGYGLISIYPLAHAASQLVGRGFAPFARADAPPGITVVVVLGSGTYTTYDWSNNQIATLDSDGLARALETARVYKLIEPAWVVCTGGSPDEGSEDRPPAEEMKRALVDLGVPASRIVVRSGLENTHDEGTMTAALLPSLHADAVVLVTTALHMRRAVGVFRAAGVRVVPAPARGGGWARSWRVRLLPSEIGLREAAAVAHELGGLIVYRVRGWM